MSIDKAPLIYAGCMPGKQMRYESACPLQKVMLHASALTQEQRALFKGEGYAFDDECKNSISHLNPWWGELTMVHWIMQVNQAPFIGNAQYRRRWRDDDLLAFDTSQVYFSQPVHFPCSLAHQFNGGHGFPGVEMTLSLAKKKRLPLTYDEMQATWEQCRFQGGPMIVAESQAYKRVMSVLFECLWPVWDEYSAEIVQLDGYDRRAMAFISERMLSGIVLFSEKFLGKMALRFSELQLLS